jgi:hypothetical protein
LKTPNTSQYKAAPATISMAHRITATQKKASMTGHSNRYWRSTP